MQMANKEMQQNDQWINHFSAQTPPVLMTATETPRRLLTNRQQLNRCR
jgi:hypothetical protein